MRLRKFDKLFWTVVFFIFYFIFSSATGGSKSNRRLSVLPQDYAYPKVQGSDINGDGKINCIDYAISYKLIWDQYNSASKYKCEIVRNKNPNTGMHHLFIRIRNFYTYEWEYIEPQNGIKMELFWGDKYNPAYNILGETEWWLQRRRSP